MGELPSCRLATWADVDRWADRVGTTVRDAGRIPDTIVGLTRGGWVHARLLADRLGVRHMLALRAAHWGVTATPSGKAELLDAIKTPLTDSNVLVVDDITDTGESLDLASRHLAELSPKRLESATLLHIEHSKHAPTYYGEAIAASRWAWVVFPWNYWEDLRALVPQAVDAAGTIRGAQRVLRERCHLDVKPSDIERALREAGAMSGTGQAGVTSRRGSPNPRARRNGS